MSHYDPDDVLYDPEDDDHGHRFPMFNPYTNLLDDPEDYEDD